MSMFDWDNLAKNLQENAFEEKKYQNEVDTRFWKLARDEDNKGGALIRFIPDPEGIPFVKLERINAGHGKGKFFVSEWSPRSIGLKDPFNDMFSYLWNYSDDPNHVTKDIAKTLGRQTRYITNIKVIKDPANPENEGKIFLFDVSQTIMDKIKAKIKPSDSEIALGEEPINIFDPINGANFLIKAKLGSNNFITYEDSKFDEKITGIYKDYKEAEKDIKENAYSLSEFIKPEAFSSYEELSKMLARFLKDDKRYVEIFGDPTQVGLPIDSNKKSGSKKEVPKEETPKEKPDTQEKNADEDDDLDALLDSLE